MRMKKFCQYDRNLLRTCLFAVLSFLTMCFIFSQSVLSREESGGLSAGIVAWLKPILDPNGMLSEDTFHYYLRKAAHFTEFAVFGCFISGFTVNFGLYLQRKYVALPLLLSLSVAVCDEFIQYFTGRGSMVTDVVIDFSGAVFGLLAVRLIIWLFGQKKRMAV